MPNRRRVVEVLTQDAVGAQQWNGARGECVTMPTDAYYAVQDAMTAVLERVARAVDWPRLLTEAASRHLVVHPDLEPDDRHWNPAAGAVCGECLCEALLADDRGAPNWRDHPVSPREQPHTDWPRVVADNLHHRAASHYHPYRDAPRTT
ncbi:hypothetical protein [Streptacidiphilus sp. EB103A]|uniref:hypothetical protein n=1 Tax=Streptacidiphilus sp. EB103A TaxID=3156275 RepID=UPI00351970CC